MNASEQSSGGAPQIKGAAEKAVIALLRMFSARRLLAAASLCTTVALSFMVLPNFVNSPLFLIASITIAHGAGLCGIALFGASVLREVLVKDGSVDGVHSPLGK